MMSGRAFAALTLFALTAAAADKEKKPPVGPVAEGTVFVGGIKLGTPNAKGGITSPNVLGVKVTVEAVDGEAFTGVYDNGSAKTKIEGKILKNGAITFKFGKNADGKPSTITDSVAGGRCTADKLLVQYKQQLGNRIGIIEAAAKADEAPGAAKAPTATAAPPAKSGGTKPAPAGGTNTVNP